MIKRNVSCRGQIQAKPQIKKGKGVERMKRKVMQQNQDGEKKEGINEENNI